MKSALVRVLLCMAALLAYIGCSHSRVQVPTPGSISTNDNSYVDLKAGTNLRIIVPVLKSGGYRPADLAVQNGDRSITVASGDVTGYVASTYAVKGSKDGIVRLHFVSAETSLNGRTLPAVNAPSLPFALPQRRAHIRLIYLVRVSETDHNMAIVASKSLQELNAFTERFKQDPKACGADDNVSCSWVPAGVAVRPEG